MVDLGTDAGVATSALLTDMSTPLGNMVGNALEVRESVEVLAGGGPADIVELTVALVAEMLRLTGVEDVDPAEVLASGAAMDVWRAMVSAQGGDPDADLPVSPHQEVVAAPRNGVIEKMDALGVGIAAWRLGAGRASLDDVIAHGAGIEIHAKQGDRVRAGDPVLTMHADDETRFARAHEALAEACEGEGALAYGDSAPDVPLVIDRIVAAESS